MTDPLESLLVDEADLSREELASLLKPYLRLTRTGELLLEGAFGELKAEDKVLCVLLAERAAHALGLRDTSGATAVEVEQISGIPGGTVRPKLSALQKARLVHKDGPSYSIPTHAIKKTSERLKRD